MRWLYTSLACYVYVQGQYESNLSNEGDIVTKGDVAANMIDFDSQYYALIKAVIVIVVVIVGKFI